jgi:DNA-binding transcriptional MerR regulator
VTTWSIGEAAEKCGLSPHTLRWYERIGLLAAIERGSDGRRRFSDADLDWLSLLTKLRATGMPVRDMQRYAELVRSGAGEAERIKLLKKHREEVRRALTAQRECLKLLDAKISYQDQLPRCPSSPPGLQAGGEGGRTSAGVRRAGSAA